MKKIPLLALLTIILLAGPCLAAERSPVTLGDNSKVELRILTRPGAKLYKEQEGQTVVDGNLPTFKPYYVYTRPVAEDRDAGNGIYEVGTDNKGKVVGWIRTEDLFEWRQAICVAFSHPEGRHPILMFEDKEPLEKLVAMGAEERKAEVDKLDGQIEKAAAEKKTLPRDFPVISREPENYVDMNKQFYLLPILEHQEITLENDREGRLLRIAAVTGNAAKSRESSDIRQNTAAVQEAIVKVSDNAERLKDLPVDVVWVIDTTRSMGPYIEKTLETVKDISKQLGEKESLTGKIRFGVWAFRDSMKIPGIEYLTKNFTEELQPVEEFVKTMASVQETKTDSIDFPEDMFAGVQDGISKTKWRNGIRIMIIVGDAPSHELGHEMDSTGQEANALRDSASANNVQIVSLHLANPRAKKFNKAAERQLRELSKNPGVDKSYYYTIPTTRQEGFKTVSKAIVDVVMKMADNAVEEMKDHNTQADSSPAADEAKPQEAAADAGKASAGEETASVAANADAPTKEDLEKLIKAAMVTWLGSETNTQAPNDVEAWVTDADIINPQTRALDVRVLLTRNQLDSLKTLLAGIIEAGKNAKDGGSESFFDALQSATTISAIDAEALKNAESLQAAGVIPNFLEGLPYKSRVMSMSNDSWKDMGPDEQDTFIREMEAKVKAYEAIHNDSNRWVTINQGDPVSEHVAAIPLVQLP